MAVEAKRGCGYRKVGGLYLVDDGAGSSCCKMPIALDICPCCGGGIKQTRGWTWVDAAKLFPPTACANGVMSSILCPAATPAVLGRVGLIWIGESFYPRPVDFLNEAGSQGISRRLSAVPRDYKAGETWVLFAHPKAIQKPRAIRELVDGDALELKGFAVTTADGEAIDGESFATRAEAETRAATLDLQEPLYGPGIIRIARPRGFEKIVKQSDYDAAIAQRAEWTKLVDAGEKAGDPKRFALADKLATDEKRGVTWVPVPDDDSDHQGTVYDKQTDPELA